MTPHRIGTNTEAGILTRLIRDRQGEISRDTANYLLSFRFDQDDVARMNDLSEMASLGTLSDADAAELDSYIHVSNLLAVMQSRARQALRSMEA
jgi:hypothetical protein